MRPSKDRQHLAAAIEVGQLRVAAGEMGLKHKPAVAALDEKRHLAGDETGAGTGPIRVSAVPAGGSDLALAARALAGRRMIRASALKPTNAMNPIILASYRLLGAG